MNPLILMFLSFFIFRQPIYAVDSTPSAIINNDKIEDLTDKLKEIVKGSSTEETIQDDQPKSFFGAITQINDNSITINSDNQNKILQLNDDITLVNSKRQKAKISDFKTGDTVLAMGYLNTDSSLDCRRIVATDSNSVKNDNQIVTGQIVDVPQSETSVFAFTPFQNKDIQYQIKFDSKTEIIDTNQKKLKSSDIIVKGKKVIIVMHPDNDNNQTFSATKIINLETEQ